MDAYYDTGVLLPLYFKEEFSEAITTLAESRLQPISLNLLQQLEMDTAIRLKYFRGEISNARMHEVLALRDGDIRIGRLVSRPVNWIAAIGESRRLGERASTQCGCRTLDLLHVAIALQYRCTLFISADDRQVKAARAIGLKTVDVRDLVRQALPVGTEPASPTKEVRETKTHYGTKKKRSPR